MENNYDPLFRQFEIMFGDKLTKIICLEGELFSVPQLEGRTAEYLRYARQAGKEFAAQGKFSASTQKKLSELLYPPEAYVEMANAGWEVSQSQEKDTKDKSLNFMRQMAAVYKPQSCSKETVIEFYLRI